MPITPFHMGPGLLVKAVGGRHVSLMVFGVSQVVMDIEPLVRMIRDDVVLHGFTHTYLGAALVGLVSMVVGRPVGQSVLDRWVPDPRSAFESWLRGPKRISWPAAGVGAFVGAYSHVVLDSMMHADLRPLAPFSETNALLSIISAGALHVGCVLGGVLGALLMVTTFLRRPLR
jgi:LexA-binding, inner membrane-associated putative hydrolase